MSAVKDTVVESKPIPPDLALELIKIEDRIERDRAIKAKAREYGVSVAAIKEEIARRQKSADVVSLNSNGAGALPPPLEPWPYPVNGADLLDELRQVIKGHLVLPAGAAEIVSLWVLFTHAHDCFEISPVLAATSPAPECGKTTLLTLLGELVPSPLPASNITGPALFRAVEKWAPTVLIDEADTFLRDSDDLRGILNSGHNKRNAWVVRTQGDEHEPRRFHTWAPKAVALIGKLPPTLSSRALHIKLQRKLSTDQVTPLRGDRLASLAPLHRKAARWASDSAENLTAHKPVMPPELQSRMADNWEPLISIADLAGGAWSEVARKIAVTAALAGRDETAAIMVLADLKIIFEARRADELHSDEIIGELITMEDRPWAEWKNGRPMTKEQLAKLLKTFEIGPKQLKIGGINKRGYELTELRTLFTRYLSATVLPFAETQGVAGDSARYQNPQTGASNGQKVAPQKPGNPQKSAKGSGVALTEPETGACAHCGGREGVSPQSWDVDGAAVYLHPGCEAGWLEGQGGL